MNALAPIVPMANTDAAALAVALKAARKAFGGARAPRAAALRSRHFDPAKGPAGMLLVPFDALGAGQCQWGLDAPGGHRFCGLPVDAAAEASVLRRRYCAHHGAVASQGPGPLVRIPRGF